MVIASGDEKRLAEVAQSYSSPLEKLKRAVSKLRVILLMLGKWVGPDALKFSFSPTSVPVANERLAQVAELASVCPPLQAEGEETA